MNTTVHPASNYSCFSINKPPFLKSSIAAVQYSSTFAALGLTSNLIAFIVLLKSFQRVQSRSRSFFLIFLGGLVVTDFMGLLVTGSIVISFYITQFSWPDIDPYCHFCNFMGMSMVFYGLSPLLLGATMAIERFIGINRPFARSTSMPKSRTVSMVLMVWLIAGCIALLPLVGLGSYHLQMPGSWCFFNISSEGYDMAFSLIFSLVGLISIAVSFLLNTVSVITLIRVCCGQDRSQRRRDHEVEMMVQLILIMLIASICWCPLLGSFPESLPPFRFIPGLHHDLVPILPGYRPQVHTLLTRKQSGLGSNGREGRLKCETRTCLKATTCFSVISWI
ncbi:thromboxane A2 receptor isoform X5 [Parambassis ranga]|uniref:Thromboxane A2 receptor n=1 Tax=Parambassis ranga TaxID=210632 RepID=A0A6P7IBQ2_9TELE|nr:thromboxane A2 receptor-like isoform X5 [Parambassis ranga]